MTTHFEKARLLVIFLIFGICVYFFQDLKNFEVLLKKRFALKSSSLRRKSHFLFSDAFIPPLPQPVITSETEPDEKAGVTSDCDDWSLQVNLSAHPMGPPGQGGASVSVPKVRR